MNRESVEQLKAKLQVDLSNTLNSAQLIEGAIAACDRLIADDDAALAEAKATDDAAQAKAKAAKKK